MSVRVGSSGFRSRGIRFCKNEDGAWQSFMKPYYELDGKERFPKEATALIREGVLIPFEKALRPDGSIDAFNFHATFIDGGEKRILSPLSDAERCVLSEIPNVFSSQFRLYTVGYRMSYGKIIGRTYYVYPVAWKGTRWGIRGVDSVEEISAFGCRFCKWTDAKETSEKDVDAFLSCAEKFKGISITFAKHKVKTLKLYARMNQRQFSSWLQRSDIDSVPYIQKFGPVVLCALRIQSNGAVSGCNLYFLQ